MFRKFISILVIQSFLFSSIAFAGPVTNVNTGAQQKDPSSAVHPSTITIEKDNGLIKSRFLGNSGKLIINIQDAHCNYEAQTNIVKILETLIKSHNLKLISVEGADGLIDTTWFKAFPDEQVREEVAGYFMKKGEITGPEFLAITKNYPTKLFGAENRSYYIQNLNAFTSSYPLKADTEKYYNSIKGALNRLKGFIYTADLKDMDVKAADYDSKKMQFNDYIRFLQSMADKCKLNLRSYENLFRLISVLSYEKKIDFTVTDKERSALIDELSKLFSKDALTDLVSQSMAFKSGKITSVEFYAYLKKAAVDNSIDLSKKYPNLYNYTIYNSVYAKIDNEKLFNDIKTVQTDIKEKLFTNDDQRTLDKLSSHIDILLGMVNIKLLNGDFTYYQTHRDEFTHEAFANFIIKQAAKYGLAYDIEPPSESIAKSIPKLEDFYAIATKRDKMLVENTLAEMKREGESVAVLVTGGFHTEGMSKLLEKQGVSYIVVCPSITKDVPSPYIQILTNQKMPLEDMLAAPEAKKGMLAPMPMTPWLHLTPGERQKLRKEIIAEAPEVERENVGKLLDSVEARLKGIDMPERFMEKQLAHLIENAKGSPDIYDTEAMRRIYIEGMLASSRASALEAKRFDAPAGSNVELTRAESGAADKVTNAVIGRSGFDREFNIIYHKLISARGDTAAIRGNSGARDSSKPSPNAPGGRTKVTRDAQKDIFETLGSDNGIEIKNPLRSATRRFLNDGTLSGGRQPKLPAETPVNDISILLRQGVRYIGSSEETFGKYKFFNSPENRPFRSISESGPYYTDVNSFIDGRKAGDVVLRYVHQQIGTDLPFEQWRTFVKRQNSSRKDIGQYRSLSDLRGIYAFQIQDKRDWYLAGFYGDSEATEDITVINVSTMEEVSHFKNPHYAYTDRASIRVNGAERTVEFFGRENNPDTTPDYFQRKVTVKLPESGLTQAPSAAAAAPMILPAETMETNSISQAMSTFVEREIGPNPSATTNEPNLGHFVRHLSNVAANRKEAFVDEGNNTVTIRTWDNSGAPHDAQYVFNQTAEDKVERSEGKSVEPVMGMGDELRETPRVVREAATVGQQPEAQLMTAEEIGQYNDEAKIRLKNTLKIEGKIINAPKDLAVVIAIDTRLDEGTQTHIVAQKSEQVLRALLGNESIFVVRAKGDDLLSAVISQVSELQSQKGGSKRVAVVVNAGETVSPEVEGQFRTLVNSTNEVLNGQGRSALLRIANIKDRAISLIDMLDVDVRIAYGLTPEEIIDRLTHVAINDKTESPFTKDDLDAVLSGWLRLRPVLPVDINDVDNMRRSEEKALHSL